MLTASVIPLVRMPRRFGVFSYNIPDDLVGNLDIGHLVIIPFRTKEIFGVVVQIQTTSDSEQSLKSIRRKIGDKPLFGPNHIEMMRIFSDWYGISLSNSALLFVPPLQKRKLLAIARDVLDEIKPQEKKSKKINYHLYIDEIEHKKYLSNAISGNTLILAPSKEVQKQIFNLLSPEQQKNTVLWDSTLGPKKKFDAWWNIRKGTKSIVLGTKSAVFFPFTRLGSIIIDHEESEYHKNWDQSPRFQTKDIAQLLANFYSSELHYLSFSPSIESYAQIFADTYNLPSRTEKITKQQRLFTKNSTKQKPVIVDMRDERKARNYTLFSDAVVDAILNAHDDLFIHINRLGSATSVGCQDCGFTSTCPTCNLPLVYHEIERVLVCPYGHTKQPMMLICPKCNSSLVRLRGAGTELVEKEIRRLLSEKKTHSIVRVDSETAEIEPNLSLPESPVAIIGTDMVLPYVRWDKTETIIFVDLDKQLAFPEYKANERVWHTLRYAEYMRSEKSSLLIQTFHPDHLVFRSLMEPDRLYRTELNDRSNNKYPPYTYIIRYLFGHKDPNTAAIEAKKVYNLIQNKLTTEQKSLILLPPIETQPKSYRGVYWQTLIVKASASEWPQELSWLNKNIPENWKVDPNPISLLQP